MAVRPFFAHEDAGSLGDRRLLVISYHFPPDRAVGARRWEKFAAFVAERGWGMDVVMCAAPSYSPDDPRLAALPPNVRVFAVPPASLALERMEQRAWSSFRRVLRSVRARADDSAAVPAGTAATAAPAATPPASLARHELRWALSRPRGFFRAYWAWLDFERIRTWGTAASAVAHEIFVPGVHRAVITSGPPFMVHDAGRRVAAAHRIPFVMDMRDPWSHAERLPEAIATPLWLRLAARYERRAVDQASLVVANTEIARRQMAAAYPDRAADVITVTNGADEDSLPPQRRGGKFVVAHAGTLYLDRDPRGLFQAAAGVIRSLQLTPAEFGLAFIGELEAVGGFPIEEVARAEGIADYVETGPLRPYAEAMRFMADATMLVTMSGSNMAAIPAKTFECLRFPAWVLALSAPGSATEQLLEGTSADVAATGDVDRITRILRHRYEEHRRGVAPGAIADAQRFSRRYQAGLLLDALERVVNPVASAAHHALLR